MATKHVALTDEDYVVIGRRHGSEDVRAEVGEALERLERDLAVLTEWGFGQASLTALAALRDEHGKLLSARSEAVAAKFEALTGRDAAVNTGWRFVQQVEGALTVAALGEADLASALNAALPTETAGLEAGIGALAKVLDAWKAKTDPGFDAPSKVAAAADLAGAVRESLDAAAGAKLAPMVDTREIDLLDGKLATWVARLNKTARRAFRAAGDDVKVHDYRFHHLSRGGSKRPAAPAPTPSA